VLRKIRSGDGFPGVADNLFGRNVYLYDAHADDTIEGPPGEVIGRRHHAICRATVDEAVWITHLKPAQTDERTFKAPAAAVLGADIDTLPLITEPTDGLTWREIRYDEADGVGYLYFPFYNGALSTDQCRRLERAYRRACGRDTRVLVLMGGSDFWSNGMHLGAIEAADSQAEESWDNINAIDDLCRAIITTESHLTIAAMRGNAGAGGVFLALAADRVVAASNVVLNPHYKNMGNLYGSEYWTYLLPRRVGPEALSDIVERRLPIGAQTAARIGLIDERFDALSDGADSAIRHDAAQLAGASDLPDRIAEKINRRKADETEKTLESYRDAELERMRLNFFGFDPSYHVARYNFIRKVPQSRTPLFLAKHRRLQSR
jgi:putative two-component system protein, hydrogenase maturation factor HypX/HoxX